MKIIAVDDEENALDALSGAIIKASPDTELNSFRKVSEALDFVKQNGCDVAFLDIEMRVMNGIELAKKIKGINPKINIVFVTGYSQYMQEAFSLYVSGYVMKPVTPDKVLRELANLRNPIQTQSRKRVRVQTFGNFEVFVDGKPLKFSYAKTKELFAYMVDRKGAFCTNGEIMSVLWEDEEGLTKRRSYVSNLRSDLMKTLEKYLCKNIVDKQRGNISVIPEEIECDYFDWLNSKAYAINAYQGEYMSQYSWAEITLGEITASLL